MKTSDLEFCRGNSAIMVISVFKAECFLNDNFATE